MVIVTGKSYDSVLVGTGKQKGLESLSENYQLCTQCRVKSRNYGYRPTYYGYQIRLGVYDWFTLLNREYLYNIYTMKSGLLSS